jgi:hypothetical protein
LDLELASELFNPIYEMTSDHQIPVQYDKIFDLLSQYSQKYYTETQDIFRKLGRQWNPYPCRFEIDTFFLYELSSSMQSHEHNKTVLTEICFDFENRISQSYANRFAIEGDLKDILRNRIIGYCERSNYAVEKKESSDMAVLKMLLQKISSANCDNPVSAESVFVIEDCFEELEITSKMFPIQTCVSGFFCCCLKHLFKATSDIRTLSLEEMDSMIKDGRREAEKILSESY